MSITINVNINKENNLDENNTLKRIFELINENLKKVS